jgi:hypothetical protein
MSPDQPCRTFRRHIYPEAITATVNPLRLSPFVEVSLEVQDGQPVLMRCAVRPRGSAARVGADLRIGSSFNGETGYPAAVGDRRYPLELRPITDWIPCGRPSTSYSPGEFRRTR